MIPVCVFCFYVQEESCIDFPRYMVVSALVRFLPNSAGCLFGHYGKNYLSTTTTAGRTQTYVCAAAYLQTSTPFPRKSLIALINHVSGLGLALFVQLRPAFLFSLRITWYLVAPQPCVPFRKWRSPHSISEANRMLFRREGTVECLFTCRKFTIFTILLFRPWPGQRTKCQRGRQQNWLARYTHVASSL